MNDQLIEAFFNEAARILALSEPSEKCEAIFALHECAKQVFSACASESESIVNNIELSEPDACRLPGYPEALELVAPRDLKRRGLAAQSGRNVLIHAIAHIEYNAMNLALDAAYRFRAMPPQFYLDWMFVAADEARHFTLLQKYLAERDYHYGDFKAHNGLWEMAEKTAHDVVARMALVPRVMEARGLDVTPKMIERLERVGDEEAVRLLKIIYNDEIGHVKIGSNWYERCAVQAGLQPRAHFFQLIDQYLHGELRGPFNLPARLKAGFDQMELDSLQTRYPQ